MRRLPLPLLPRWLRYLGVVSVAGTVFYFSVLSPPPATPPDSGPFWDKQLHFASYAGLAGSLAYATVHLRDRLWTRIAIVLGLAIGYGLLVEAIQSTQPGRYASLGDALANGLGALLASVWFLVESRFRYVRPVDVGSADS